MSHSRGRSGVEGRGGGRRVNGGREGEVDSSREWNSNELHCL